MEENNLAKMFQNIDYIRQTLIGAWDKASIIEAHAIPDGLYTHLRIAREILEDIIKNDLT